MSKANEVDGETQLNPKTNPIQSQKCSYSAEKQNCHIIGDEQKICYNSNR
jgi:hypothetical protein